ncbi:ester cyclase [Amnibacterium kyonggiense]
MTEPTPTDASGATTDGRPIISADLSEARTPRTMPPDLSIAVRPGSGRDTARAERERGTRRQSMRGFEDAYTDIVDWIVRVTHRIWEEQDVGYVYDTYATGAFVFTDHGPQWGVERVVEDTVQSIHAFPDTRSLADEVIWAGNDVEGFVTSHRYITAGHHLAPWRWGPATGRHVRLWGIANCVVRENEIYEEYVLYNTCSRLAQLGIDVAAAARQYGDELHRVRTDAHVPEVDRLLRGRHPEPYPAGGDRFDLDHAVRALFHDVWNRRDLSAVNRAYAANVRWHGTSDRVGYGRADVQSQARALLATFPDLGLRVEEIYWMGNDEEGYRASVRWSAAGTHRGYALYGEPTGRRAFLWGISQLYFSNGLITEEWSMFNEFDVLAQLLSTEPRPLFPTPQP